MLQNENKLGKNGSFLYSILTATATGMAIGLILLFIFTDKEMIFDKRSGKNTSAVSDAKDYSQNEEDEDGTFITHFSRAYIYSKDYEGEVIEKAQDSLPKSYRQGEVTAKAFAVIDADKDITLIEKDSDRLFPIASITKLVTAVVAKKLIKENQGIDITSRMLAPSGSSAHFRVGEKFTVNELLYPLLMVSSNDAAEVLAESYGKKEFVKEMNSFVNKIGAYKTYFADPAGLSPNNVSTVHDLVIITKWILEHDPDIIDITLEKSKDIRIHTWINPTHFLNLSSYAGGKNGYLPEAGRTSVSLWRLGKNKKLYISILLNSQSRDADTLKILDLSLK